MNAKLVFRVTYLLCIFLGIFMLILSKMHVVVANAEENSATYITENSTILDIDNSGHNSICIIKDLENVYIPQEYEDNIILEVIVATNDSNIAIQWHSSSDDEKKFNSHSIVENRKSDSNLDSEIESPIDSDIKIQEEKENIPETGLEIFINTEQESIAEGNIETYIEENLSDISENSGENGENKVEENVAENQEDSEVLELLEEDISFIDSCADYGKNLNFYKATLNLEVSTSLNKNYMAILSDGTSELATQFAKISFLDDSKDIENAEKSENVEERFDADSFLQRAGLKFEASYLGTILGMPFLDNSIYSAKNYGDISYDTDEIPAPKSGESAENNDSESNSNTVENSAVENSYAELAVTGVKFISMMAAGILLLSLGQALRIRLGNKKS